MLLESVKSPGFCISQFVGCQATSSPTLFLVACFTLPSPPVFPASAAAPTPPSPSNTGLTGFGAKQGGLGTSFDSLQLLGTSWVIKIWVTVYVGHRFTANKLLGTRLKC